MNILVACEESQVVTKELRKLGHCAYSCDIIPCSGGYPEWHIMQDVVPLLNGFCLFQTCDGIEHFLNERWDMIIAFPPCTYMSKAGARFMYPTAGKIDLSRFEKALAAKDFFMKFFNADCEKIAIENPTPLKVVDLPKETQVIQPYFFGSPYTKRTLLWLKGLPLLMPDNIVEPIGPYIPSFTSRKDKTKYGFAKRNNDSVNRSKTFPGVAAAMAKQWTL